jgi:hypothetical protein
VKKPRGVVLTEANAPWIARLLRGEWYRGTSTGGKGIGLGLWGVGLYLTWRKGMAKFFASRHGAAGVVHNYRVHPGLKILDGASAEMAKIKRSLGVEPWDKIDDPFFARALTDEVKGAGYDGIINDNPADGLVLFDPKDATLLHPGHRGHLGQARVESAEPIAEGGCGDCYRWAWKYVTKRDDPNVLLVHGTVHPVWHHRRYAHAWVEINGKGVKDWQNHAKRPRPEGVERRTQPIPMARFYGEMRPQDIKKFTAEEAYRAVGTEFKRIGRHHFGPWGESIAEAETKLRWRKREWEVGKVWDHAPPNWYWNRGDYFETGDESQRIAFWTHTKREAVQDLVKHLAGQPDLSEHAIAMQESTDDGLAPDDWDKLNDWWFDYSGWEGDFDYGTWKDPNGLVYLWSLDPEGRDTLKGKLSKRYPEIYVQAIPDISDVTFATPQSSDGREMMRLLKLS